ncbi:tyrosine-protein phosphatase [Phenylobacterium sp. LjRoot225]|uniref:tyrosine-protein phosphatase n=1 Tax=Phenylobacterium sp. LjRoot225 TaxID=3342285 RepID=UPI003ED06833
MDRRELLMAAVANGALAAAPAALAAAKLEGRATRTSAQAVRLDWEAPRRPASIFVSSDPDAQKPYMRAIRSGVRGGRAELPLPVSPRPYFLLSTPDGAQVRVAERLLPLQGGRNFRDLGGYRSADGRQVRWGRIYRSGVMSGLTLADMSYLSGLGVEVICDLRSVQERTSQPNPFQKAEAPRVVGTDYDMMSFDGLHRATTRAEAVDAFAASYVQFTEILAPQYTDLFARLVRRETPLAFNCSAGKDRTGMGAALILSVLGVPRETVVADYRLTEIYAPPSMYAGQAPHAGPSPGITPEQSQAFARMPREVMQVMRGSDPAVMRQALARIDQKFGGPIELAKARFGLTDARVAYLRGVYLI